MGGRQETLVSPIRFLVGNGVWRTVIAPTALPTIDRARPQVDAEDACNEARADHCARSAFRRIVRRGAFERRQQDRPGLQLRRRPLAALVRAAEHIDCPQTGYQLNRQGNSAHFCSPLDCESPQAARRNSVPLAAA
jgi:hypothetical protein